MDKIHVDNEKGNKVVDHYVEVNIIKEDSNDSEQNVGIIHFDFNIVINNNMDDFQVEILVEEVLLRLHIGIKKV